MIGPVVKIDPAHAPQHPNIHYLGGKKYNELPRYMAGWDAAMMPFARNESTRFISPTKTPEYLAAGLPSRLHIDPRRGSPVRRKGLGRRSATPPQEFAAGVDAALELNGSATWLAHAGRRVT